ncbi:DUF2333 family protein [Thermodesulfobacteriota bacterium]
MTDNKPDTGSKEFSPNKTIITAVVVVVFFIFCMIVMVKNSVKPDPVDLSEVTGNEKGLYFVKANQELIKQMKDNWIPNDMFWPTVFLDNMPNFQLGQLEVARYNTRVLRDNLTRMRTTDKLDPFAETAFTSLSNDPYKWWFPSAESKWQKGYENLDKFHENLVSGKTTFYPRADNLIQLLDQYISLMGGVNTKLIAAAGDTGKVEIKGKEILTPVDSGEKEIEIPWHEIDDNFYYAQGVAYALHLSFKAIRKDFYAVLQDKNSVNLVDKIIDTLSRCYFEPLIVFNGDPDSIFANHSLNLSGVFNDARQKINSLTSALDQG